MWNANLMQQGNFINRFLAGHVSNAPDDGRMYPKHVELRIY